MYDYLKWHRSTARLGILKVNNILLVDVVVVVFPPRRLIFHSVSNTYKEHAVL